VTAPIELTVIHRGGSRRGDVVIATSAEYHALERLRAMETRLLALAAGAESAHTQVSTVDLRTAIGGAA
jgi:hypothetical protein